MYYLLWKLQVSASTPAIALKFIGFLTQLALVYPVVRSLRNIVQFLCFVLIIGVLVAFGTELWLFISHYRIRRATPRFMNRGFKRLGAVMAVSGSPIRIVYQIFFGFVGVSLLLVHMVLIFVQYFHTAWLFNRKVALRLLPPKT